MSYPQKSITLDVLTSLKDNEDRLILAALEAVKHNHVAAASILGISRRGLYLKLDKIKASQKEVS